MTIKLTKIEWPFNSDDARLFCPFCGRPAWPVGEKHEACPHLVFSFSRVANAFDWLPEALESKRDLLEAHAPEGDRIGARLSRLLGLDGASQAVAFELTTGGVGCGPVWTSDLVLFALRPSASQVERQPGSEGRKAG